MYEESRLLRCEKQKAKVDTDRAKWQRERRCKERDSYLELSRYYMTNGEESCWTRPALLSRGKSRTYSICRQHWTKPLSYQWYKTLRRPVVHNKSRTIRRRRRQPRNFNRIPGHLTPRFEFDSPFLCFVFSESWFPV